MQAVRTFTLAFVIFFSVAAMGSVVKSTFSFNQSSYSVAARFRAKCPRDSLLSICYSYSHINKYLRRPNLTITPLEEGATWNRYRYVYTYVVYSCSLTFRRDIVPDSGLLRFRLLDVRSTKSIFPTVANSWGYYRVDSIPGTDSTQLSYGQTTVLTKPINILYATIIRFETNGFLRRLIDYIKLSK
jgi:hypothetical protein